MRGSEVVSNNRFEGSELVSGCVNGYMVNGAPEAGYATPASVSAINAAPYAAHVGGRSLLPGRINEHEIQMLLAQQNLPSEVTIVNPLEAAKEQVIAAEAARATCAGRVGPLALEYARYTSSGAVQLTSRPLVAVADKLGPLRSQLAAAEYTLADARQRLERLQVPA